MSHLLSGMQQLLPSQQDLSVRSYMLCSRLGLLKRTHGRCNVTSACACLPTAEQLPEVLGHHLPSAFIGLLKLEVLQQLKGRMTACPHHDWSAFAAQTWALLQQLPTPF